jgi:hypothetical protein
MLERSCVPYQACNQSGDEATAHGCRAAVGAKQQLGRELVRSFAVFGTDCTHRRAFTAVSTVCLFVSACIFSTPSVASTIASSLGVYPYPRHNQSAAQQSKDESACYDAALQRTGINPHLSAAATPQPAAKVEGRGIRGAAGGAAVGAAIGAIAGNAGAGAGAGAVAGVVRGTRTQNAANANAQKQAQAEAQAQHAQRMNAFTRAFSACLDAKGYSVK